MGERRAAALSTIDASPPDLILLDLEVDKIVGLEIGADDYAIKPFNARELVARLRANCA